MCPRLCNLPPSAQAPVCHVAQSVTCCGPRTGLHAGRAANRDCCGPTPPVAGFFRGGSGGGTRKSGRCPSLQSEPVVNAGMAMWRHMTLVLTAARRSSVVCVSTPVQALTELRPLYDTWRCSIGSGSLAGCLHAVLASQRCCQTRSSTGETAKNSCGVARGTSVTSNRALAMFDGCRHRRKTGDEGRRWPQTLAGEGLGAENLGGWDAAGGLQHSTAEWGALRRLGAAPGMSTFNLAREGLPAERVHKHGLLAHPLESETTRHHLPSLPLQPLPLNYSAPRTSHRFPVMGTPFPKASGFETALAFPFSPRPPPIFIPALITDAAAVDSTLCPRTAAAAEALASPTAPTRSLPTPTTDVDAADAAAASTAADLRRQECGRRRRHRVPPNTCHRCGRP